MTSTQFEMMIAVRSSDYNIKLVKENNTLRPDRALRLLSVSVCMCVWDLPEVPMRVFLLCRVRIMGCERACLLCLLLLRHASGHTHTHT